MVCQKNDWNMITEYVGRSDGVRYLRELVGERSLIVLLLGHFGHHFR